MPPKSNVLLLLVTVSKASVRLVLFAAGLATSCEQLLSLRKLDKVMKYL